MYGETGGNVAVAEKREQVVLGGGRPSGTYGDSVYSKLTFGEGGSKTSEGKQTEQTTTAPVTVNKNDTVIKEAAGYAVPNYRASTREKIQEMGLKEDYAYVSDRIDGHTDKVKYLQKEGFKGDNLNDLVENFVMGLTAKSKMTVADEEYNIGNKTYIEGYIFGYSTAGTKSERNEKIRKDVDELPGLDKTQQDALYDFIKVSRGKDAKTGERAAEDPDGGEAAGGGLEGRGEPKKVLPVRDPAVQVCLKQSLLFQRWRMFQYPRLRQR